MSGFTIGLEFLPPKKLIRFRNAVGAYTVIDPSIASVAFIAKRDSITDPLDAIFQTIPEIRQVFASEGLSQTPIAAHLTCKGVPMDRVEEIADRLWKEGIRDLVVLTGDLAEGEVMPPAYFNSSTPLTAALFQRQNFNISVAGHPRFISDIYMDGLKKKIDAGATRVITQYDFETENYLRFEERARASGITVPIAHGIMPISSFERTSIFARENKVLIPDAVVQRFDRHGGNLEAEALEGRIFLGEQLEMLQTGGVKDIHIYTLNRTKPALEVLAQFQKRSAMADLAVARVSPPPAATPAA